MHLLLKFPKVLLFIQRQGSQVQFLIMHGKIVTEIPFHLNKGTYPLQLLKFIPNAYQGLFIIIYSFS